MHQGLALAVSDLANWMAALGPGTLRYAKPEDDAGLGLEARVVMQANPRTCVCYLPHDFMSMICAPQRTTITHGKCGVRGDPRGGPSGET